jgi:hypothetical protein
MVEQDLGHPTKQDFFAPRIEEILGSYYLQSKLTMTYGKSQLPSYMMVSS